MSEPTPEVFPSTNESLEETELADELDKAIWGFDDIQAEINYKQATDTLHNLVARLNLQPQERQGLETEIAQLETMLGNLEHRVVQIAVFGMVGRGKSSLLNALLGQQVFETGPLHGVTRSTQKAQWEVTEETIGAGDRYVKFTLPSSGDSQVELIDTPGLDEVDGETRAALAEQIANRADLILFAIAGDMTQVEHSALAQLREAGKPILLVFNKIDQYPQVDRMAIYEKIRDERVKELLSPDEIVMAAASPMTKKAIVRADGTRSVQLSHGQPQVEELKLKILEILHREGKALVALNTMLFADNVNEQVVKRKLEIRASSADRLIWRATMTKAVAIALNPITMVDLLSGAAIDVMLILSLAKLYDIPMTQTGAIQLLQKIALSLGGISASELLANLGLSSLKSLLGIATPATGGIALAPYLSVAITQAGVAGVSAYSIGQVTKTYLANGATWGPEGPKAVINRILSSLDQTSILNRIKDELVAKLGAREQ